METMNVLGGCAAFLVCLASLAACDAAPQLPQQAKSAVNALIGAGNDPRVNKDWKDSKLTYGLRLSAAAEERATHSVVYDAAYVQIAYPNGDVAADRGVCADEVVRAYRLLGVDLQKLVHEDMKAHFNAYPKQWGLSSTDKNIDHRRVPNLQTFFKRRGASLAVTQNADDYKPGDLITCTVAGKLPHIAIVVPAPDGGRPWIVHNIGAGPQMEDRLFEFPLTGHYRWHPAR